MHNRSESPLPALPNSATSEPPPQAFFEGDIIDITLCYPPARAHVQRKGAAKKETAKVSRAPSGCAGELVFAVNQKEMGRVELVQTAGEEFVLAVQPYMGGVAEILSAERVYS